MKRPCKVTISKTTTNDEERSTYVTLEIKLGKELHHVEMTLEDYARCSLGTGRVEAQYELRQLGSASNQ